MMKKQICKVCGEEYIPNCHETKTICIVCRVEQIKGLKRNDKN